jgi:flagellar biosynthesis protein FlhF
MRQAMRAIRERLGEDAVILSSRRLSDGVEVTAAIDFDAQSLEGTAVEPLAESVDSPLLRQDGPSDRSAAPSARDATPVRDTEPSRRETRLIRDNDEPVRSKVPTSFNGSAIVRESAHYNPTELPVYRTDPSTNDAPTARSSAVSSRAGVASGNQRSAHDAVPSRHEAQRFEAGSPLISSELQTALLESLVVRTESSPPPAGPVAQADRTRSAAPAAPATRVPHTVAAASNRPATTPQAAATAPHGPATATDARSTRVASPAATATDQTAAVHAAARAAGIQGTTDASSVAATATQPLDFDLTELIEAPQPATRASHSAVGTDLVGTELKNLRRMLETQLAQLAWNDMTRRAPIHTEMLRELSEIGIAQDLATQITQQLPQDVDLTYARRFSIAALSQYLLVTGDRWLDNGGRIAFIGSTGVGKTMTLSKLAVRWVLRHGPRDIALVGADNIRLGAQEQMRSLGQLLGVPVYTPENFETLPTLLSRLQQRFILIDTPGSSLRDTQLSSRLAVLASSASQLQTALVLAASTQAGALEEVVKRFAPANPCCCVLTKVDEAASLGGALSVLIRARVPVSYVSEGQRVPEDLRPARALELVSQAVRLAKATGASADEDLLRRRFGKIANAFT